MVNTTRSGRLTKFKGQAASIAPGLVVAVISFAPQAQAADECGPDGPDADIVTCAGGAYPDGITYTDSDGMTLVLDDPTIIVMGEPTNSAILFQSNTTTTQSVEVIVRQFDVVSLSDSDEPVILVDNQGLGAATARVESGVIRKSNLLDQGFGIASSITNAANTHDAETIIIDGRIETVSDAGVGAVVINADSGTARASITGGTIRTVGDAAPGLSGTAASPGSTASVFIRMSGGDISTTGDGYFIGGLAPHGIYGLTTNLSDVAILMEGGSVSTTGDNAYGILSERLSLFSDVSGGTNTMSATLTGGRIATLGANSHGMVERTLFFPSGADARTRMEDGSITVRGNDAVAMFADNWGRGLAEAVMTGGQITNSGVNGKGIFARAGEWASGQVARVQVSGGMINTGGDGGYLVHARSETDAAVEVAVKGGTHSTTGEGAYGIFADHAVNFGTEGINFSVTDGTITTSGADAYGIYALNVSERNTRVLTAMDITTSGERADVIRIDARENTFDVDVTAGQLTSLDASGVGIRTLAAAGGTIDIHAGAVVDGSQFGYSIIDGEAAPICALREPCEEASTQARVMTASRSLQAALLPAFKFSWATDRIPLPLKAMQI